MQDRIELEHQLAELSKQLELRERQLLCLENLSQVGMLTSQIVHNMKNLLNLIMGYSLILSEEIPESSILQKIINIVEKADEMIKVNLTKVANQKDEMKPLDLNQILTDEISFFSSNMLDEHKITFIIELGDIPLVHANKCEFSQVFSNIICNAIDALINVKNPVLKIKSTYELCCGEIVFEFTDNGCGIPLENLQRIFDPFFTTKSNCKCPKFGGTGIGLAYVKKVLESHGGKIKVQSQINEGTQMTLIIPR